MARTSGHGNPDWSRDETLLALELYQQSQDQVPGPNDARVIELSRTLQALPIHPAKARKDTFRNPEGVAFKLQNIRSVATGKGLKNTAATDRLVWERFGTSPEDVKRLAALIRAGAERVGDEPIEEDFEFGEGRVLTKLHRQRERGSGVRKAVLKARRKAGSLRCDCCSTRGLAGDAEAAIFDVHHLVPLSHMSERVTRLADVCLLCANCHRAIHRAIAESGRWILPAELASSFELPWRPPPR
jgi:5-methylcytosine-specific restriction protein A